MGAERPEDDPSEGASELELTLGANAKYRLEGRLGAGGMGIVYRALDVERGVRVALKTLHTTNAQTLYRFKQEFRSLAEIVHPRLVRLYELVADGERWYFSMELIEDGVSLLDWVRREALPTRGALEQAETMDSRPPPARESAPTRVDSERRVAQRASMPEPEYAPASSAPPSWDKVRAAFAQLAEGVHVLHLAGKLHRDLKPENVFVRGASGDVLLLDFGLVAALEGTAARSSLPGLDLQHDLEEESGQHDSGAYHATQAGLIAGTFAYMAPEQALAQPLTAAADWYAVGVILYEVLTGVLPYQGSGAQILTRKQSSDAIPPHVRVPSIPEDLSVLAMDLLHREPSERPSGAEVVARLGGVLAEVPANDVARHVFTGRERQLATLQQAFTDSERALATVHVHGRSGAGKSVLLARFLDELSGRADTLVLEGRCYEQEFIPYKALDVLMDALTRYLLLLPPEELRALLPDDAHVLTRVFPVFGRLFPASEQRAGEDPHAVRKRAFVAVRELLVRLGESVRLVWFIDDLQWGDVDSAALLAEVLRAPGAPKLLLVLAYRDEQQDSNASLSALREATRGASVIDVGALDAEEARELAAQLLAERSTPGTLDWTLKQARGSAFLIHELARYLQAGGAPAGAQDFALDDILWERVRSLPAEQRALLTMVAIAGRPMRLRRLQNAAALTALAPSVVPALCHQRLLRTQGTGAAAELETFHDRVRESILARTPGQELARCAAQLVRELERAKEGDAETRAALYERAGDPGRASGYYVIAVQSAVAALAFQHAERLAFRAIELARSDEQLAQAYETAVHFYTDMACFADAYTLTRKGAAALGVELPEKFVPPLLLADLLAVQLRLRGKRPHELRELPTMPAGKLRLAVRLANAGAKAAFQLRPELCVAVCTKLVRLCLAHGNSPDSAIGYMVFGAIFQGGILGRYRTGHDFGELALALVDKYQNERQRAEVSFVVGYFGVSWLRPAREAEALWQTAYEAGRATGDLFHMGCAAAGRMMSYAMRGVALERVENEGGALCEVLARHGLHEQLAVVSSARQLARDLRGRTPTAGLWHEADYDDAHERRALRSFGTRHFAHCCLLLRVQAAYLWGRLDEAIALLEEAAQLAPASRGMLHSAEHVYLRALVLAALPAPGPRQKLTVWRAARRLRAWSARCPENFAPKAELLHAEALRLTGCTDAALAAYARAAQLATQCEQVHIEAIANLLAARLQQVTPERASASFERWGASALAEHLAG
ncbi:MAG TPA: protein kinase [Polyangiales bacterium]|nr:protein kinase [Polyangiales bacterium]